MAGGHRCCENFVSEWEGTRQAKAGNVQGQHEGEQEREKKSRDLSVRRHGSNGLADGSVVEREEDGHEEVSETCAIRGEADRPVPAEEEKR